MQKHIRDVRPERPSTRVGRAGDAGTAIARSRLTNPKRLVQRLGGGLDAIALKALEKDRARRYDSAGAMAADVRRFLAGEAVLAVAPTTAYLVGVFLRRHAVAATAAALVAVALLAATGVSIGFAREARLTANAEAEARRRAESLNAFITSVLATTNPQIEGKTDTTVVQAMELAIREIDRGALADMPETRASLFGTITDVMRGHGRDQEAAAFAAREVALRREHPGDGRLLVHALAQQARMLRIIEKDTEAMAAATEAVRLQQALAPADAYLEGQAWLGLADAQIAAGDYPAAEQAARRAVAALERSTEKPSFLAASHQRIATALRRQRKFEESEAAYLRAIEVDIEEDPRPRFGRANARHNLGIMQHERGEYAKAVAPLQQSLAEKRQIFAGDHLEITRTLRALGAVYANLGRFQDAEAMHREDVAMVERLGLDEAELTAARALLANTWMELRKFSEAEAVFAAALDYRRRAGPPIDVAFALSNLARARHGLGRHQEAWRLFAEAHQVSRALLPASAAGHCRVLFRSANARLEAGDVAEAVRQLEEAVAVAQQTFPDGNARRVEYERALSAGRERLRK